MTPSLFSLMGFQALVINRIHHQIKDFFKQSKHMEFLWRGSAAAEPEAAQRSAPPLPLQPLMSPPCAASAAWTPVLATPLTC